MRDFVAVFLVASQVVLSLASFAWGVVGQHSCIPLFPSKVAELMTVVASIFAGCFSFAGAIFAS